MVTAWKGSWKKEWVMMKDWLFATAVMAVLLVTAVCVGMSFLIEGKLSLTVVNGMSGLMWTIISVCLPVSLLLNSLWKEWKRPDVWLHSPQSIYHLFGSKVAFAAVIGFVVMLPLVVMLAIFAELADGFATAVGIPAYIRIMAGFLSGLYAAAVGLLLIGLFFAVVYRVIKSYIRRGAVFVWLAVLFISLWMSQLFVESRLYQMIYRIRPLTANQGEQEITIGNFYFSSASEPLYMGELLLIAGFYTFLFVAAAWLFEKKVRL